jgi:hypothetical protein
MLTLFALPKPFQGHIEVIQRNAIQSWLWLRPSCEVILLGDEPGTLETAAEFNVRHIRQVARNEYGTPLVNSVFAEAEKAATYPLMAYVNADIILTSDFLPAIERVLRERPRSLMVGRRWDLDVRHRLDFTRPWEASLRDLLRKRGKLHSHTAIDYFVFPNGAWGEIPPFAIGRFAWDNWLLYRAHSQGTPIVDLTKVVTAIHQNHDFLLCPEQGEAQTRDEEFRRNAKLAGGIVHGYTLWDAQYELTEKGVRRAVNPYLLYRTLVTAAHSRPALRPLVRLIRLVRGVY